VEAAAVGALPQLEWLPVAEAAEIVGKPERSLRNWIKAKLVPTRTEGGITLVDVAAVRAVVASRAANGSGHRPGDGGGGRAVPSVADGDLSARVFEAFDRGEAPADLVRSERIPPPLALTLWEQYQKLTQAGGKGRPSASERLDVLEKQLKALTSKVEELAEGLGTEILPLGRQLQAVAGQLGELTLPKHRTDVSCQCGARGFYGSVLRCTCCGREQVWGFQPPRRG
jgi:hypothetical protein